MKNDLFLGQLCIKKAPIVIALLQRFKIPPLLYKEEWENLLPFDLKYRRPYPLWLTLIQERPT